MWLRLFWVESVVLPGVGLFLLASYPPETKYRTLNLIMLALALGASLAGFAYSEWRRARKGALHGPSAH